MDSQVAIDLKRFKVDMLNGHCLIEDQLASVNRMSARSAELRESLRILEEYIWGHLSRQSAKVYDCLKEVVSDNRADLKMLEFLIVDLKQIKIDTLNYFSPVPKNFQVYLKDVRNRIDVEKLYLLPLIKFDEER